MFYVDIDTKRFIKGPKNPQPPCPPGPFPPGPRPPHGRPVPGRPGQCGPMFPPPKPTCIDRPSLIYTQVVDFDIQFLKKGKPVDLGNGTLVLAVDNDFRHHNSLVCFCQDVSMTDPQQGIATFHVDCSSLKFQRLVRAHIPPSQVIMEITYFPAGSASGTTFLQDRGIQLKPKVYAYEGSPHPSSPNYYTKTQIDSILKSYAKTDSDATIGNIINGHGQPDPMQGNAGDFYVDIDSGALYLKEETGWILMGYISTGTLPELYYQVIE